MSRGEILWLAFEKFAIFFAFVVTFGLVLAILVIGFATWIVWPSVEALTDEMACPLIADVNGLVTDLEHSVITRTIPISQTIPVQFALPLDKNLTVKLTEGVQITRPASFVLPAGGGQINGTVYLVLPEGQKLPVHMNMTVPVSQTLPVQMNVDVAIPLKETDLGPVIDRLKGLLMPYLGLLDETLECGALP